MTWSGRSVVVRAIEFDIEVGAGTGAITCLMASRGADCKVIGIDPSAGLIAEAMSANHMVARGIIGEELASSLANEYIRRKDAGTLYGHQPFGTLVATLVCRAGCGVQ